MELLASRLATVESKAEIARKETAQQVAQAVAQASEAATAGAATLQVRI